MTLPGYEDKPVVSARALELSSNVLNTIKEHGIDNPILSTHLERIHELTGPEIRYIVSNARLRGEPIGSGEKGYFYARRSEELDQTIAHLRGREFKISIVRERLEYTQRQLAERSRRRSFQEAMEL